MLIIDRIEIGNRLLELRESSHMTQAKVAEKAGISEKTYAEIERGNNGMYVDTLCSICNVFGVTPDFLLVKETADDIQISRNNLHFIIEKCPPQNLQTLIKIISAYLNGL